MEDRPTAVELLQAVSALLNDEVLPVIDASLQHKVRVAANLCRIVERELVLGGPAGERERVALETLTGSVGSLAELNERYSHQIRKADVGALPGALDVLLAGVIDKLAVDKPGYALEALS
ncbi:MAG: DUF6285 domain-containing protein [Ilumatobacteraceae bacterium]